MYRLPYTLSFTLALGASAILVAKAPELEVTFLDETTATAPATAVDPEPGFSLLEQTSAAPERIGSNANAGFSLLEEMPEPQVDSKGAKHAFSLLHEATPGSRSSVNSKQLEYTFLEDMKPKSSAVSSSEDSASDRGIESIDFDQVFATLPGDQSFVARTETDGIAAPPVEAVAEPHGISTSGAAPTSNDVPSPSVVTAPKPSSDAGVDAAERGPMPVARVPLPTKTTVTPRQSTAVVALASKPLAEAVEAPAVATTDPATTDRNRSRNNRSRNNRSRNGHGSSDGNHA